MPRQPGSTTRFWLTWLERPLKHITHNSHTTYTLHAAASGRGGRKKKNDGKSVRKKSARLGIEICVLLAARQKRMSHASLWGSICLGQLFGFSDGDDSSLLDFIFPWAGMALRGRQTKK